MKTKKTLVFLLAFAMTVGAMVFASCGDDVGDSLGNTSSSSSVSGNLPSSGSAEDSVSNDVGDSGTNSSDISNTENNSTSNSDDDSSQSGGMNEAAKAALIAAAEKTTQSDNYTEKRTIYFKSIGEGSEGNYYMEEWQEGFSKIDGDKSESQFTSKQKDKPDGALTTETHWGFKQIISKTEREDGSIEGESYYYLQDENGVWYKSEGNYSIGTSESSTLMMKIYENLAYDENTGLYTLTDFTYSFTTEEILKDFFGLDEVDLDDVSIDRAEASFTVYDFQIELKDGYIYRFYVNYEQKIDISVVYEENIFFYRRGELNENVNITYSDYGTTVVTLPVVKEEIKNDIVD